MKASQNKLVLIVVFVVILIIVISIGSSSKFEYVPKTAMVFSRYVFDDSEELGLVAVKSSAGYKTGISEFPLLTWTEKKIHIEKPRTYIDISYPVFDTPSALKLNSYIKEIVDVRLEEDMIELDERIKNDPESYFSTLDLVIQYRIYGVQNGVVSIEIVATDYTGGGNGNHDYSHVVNWDLKENMPLSIENLFCKNDYLEKISMLSKKHLNDSYDLPIQESGLFPTVDNFNLILPYDKGIIVILQPYQVLSGNSGIVRIVIDENELSDILCI